MAALNTNSVFAKGAAQLPVIGTLARVLTFRSYETEKDDIAVSVEIPTIEMIASDTGITVDAVNQKILTLCTQYADAAVLRAQEYRTAFLGISEDTKLYINENNRPVIVFEKYEIAPGSSGEIEFEIAKQEAVENAAQATDGYEDNFAVDNQAAKEFAQKVKD